MKPDSISVLLGHDVNGGAAVSWEPAHLANGHCAVFGMSGTGKSHNLRGLVSGVTRCPGAIPRIHVYDVHGDLEMENESVVSFSEQTSYGLNPLVVNENADYGGPRRRIQALISIMNKTSRVLGPKQESVLRAILNDLYSANGFHQDKPASWSLQDGVTRRFPKKFPTFTDAYRFAHSKLKALYLGGVSSPAVTLIEDVNKAVIALNRGLREIAAGDSEKQKSVDAARDKAITGLTDLVLSLKTGREIEDAIRYESKEVLKSVVDRLENLNATGILKGVPPPFDTSKPVWRRKINHLSGDERKLFVLLDLYDLFWGAVQKGLSDRVREIIVLDEAHIFMDDDPENPITMISREARKFGLAIILASQTPTEYPDAVMSSMACKIVLKLDALFAGAAARKLGVEPAALDWIVPRKSGLVQFKKQGDASNSFMKTVFQ